MNFPNVLLVGKYVGRPAVRPVLAFTGLALLLLGPLLLPGYVLAVDMIFTPRLPIPSVADPAFPLFGLLHYLAYVVPAWALQKGILLSLFILAGLGGYYLCVRLLGQTSAPAVVSRYFAGVLYACNPFVYVRFMSGQYLFLLGYALLPFFMLSLLALLHKPRPSKTFGCAGLLVAIGMVSPHMLMLALLVGVLLCAGHTYIYRHETTRLRTTAKYLALGLGVWLLVSAYWIVPAVWGKGTVGTSVHTFTSQDLQAFSPAESTLPTPLNLLALQGFWGDAQNLYLLPSDQFAWWWLPLIGLGLLVGIGLWRSWQRQRFWSVFFIFLIGIGVAVGSGTSWIFSTPNSWLTEHVPLFAGFREPQKAVVLVVLAYSYFGAVGVAWLHEAITKKYQLLAAATVLVPLACTPLLPWGAGGQLHSTQYPASWFAMDRKLQHIQAGEGVLFLPWHLYMPFSFSDGTIANPAKKFFQQPIITSNDPEFRQASGYTGDTVVRQLNTSVLPRAATDPHLAATLRQMNIHYVLLAHEFDYKDYDYIRRENGFTPIEQLSGLTLYHIESKEKAR